MAGGAIAQYESVLSLAPKNIAKNSTFSSLMKVLLGTVGNLTGQITNLVSNAVINLSFPQLDEYAIREESFLPVTASPVFGSALTIFNKKI